MKNYLEEFEGNPLLKARPNFTRAYLGFRDFLEVTQADIKSKKESLESQKKSIKVGKGLLNRRIKHYLSCQLFMLRKYSSRLEGFEKEVESRLSKILKGDDGRSTPANVELSTDLDTETTDSSRNLELIETEISMARLHLEEGLDRIPEIMIEEDNDDKIVVHIENVVIDHHGDVDHVEIDHHDDIETSSYRSANSSSRSSESGLSNFSGNEDSFDSSVSTGSSGNQSPAKTEDEESTPVRQIDPIPEDEEIDPAFITQDQQLTKLFADINKMKRRCKHILDVTDQYCVLQSIDLSQSEPDSAFSVDPSQISGASTPEPQRPATVLPDPITQHLMRTTFESLGNHLAVIAKTYTRRHSNDFDVKSPKTPQEVF